MFLETSSSSWAGCDRNNNIWAKTHARVLDTPTIHMTVARGEAHLLFLAFSLETSRSYTTLFINFSCTKNTCKTPYITLKIVSSRFPQVFPIFSRLSRSKFSIKTNDQCDWVACSVRDGTTFTFEDEVGLSDQRSTMRDRRKEGRKGEVGLGCCLPTLHHRRRRRLQAHTEGSAL